MTRWDQDDAFWEAHRDAMFHEQRLAAAQPEADWILAELALPPGARVLDVPCGVGRHPIAFARRGMVVAGIDRTADYLERAKARERDARAQAPDAPWGPPVDWRLGDMASADLGSGYDLVTNLSTSFGYFETWEDNVAFAARLLGALRPGGWIVLEMFSKEVFAKNFRESNCRILPDGSIHAEFIRLTDGWSRMDNRWIVLRPDGTRLEHNVRHWVYSGRELHDMLRSIGFGEIRFFGSLAGTPFDHTATRLVLIARRP